MARRDAGQPVPSDIRQLAADVADIDTFPATGAALSASPVLLNVHADRALAELQQEAHGEEDFDRETLIGQFRAFLARCRREGLEEIFPPNHPHIDPKVVSAITSDMNTANEAEADYDRAANTEDLTDAAAAWRRVLEDGSLASAYPGLRAAVSNDAGQLLLRRYWAMGAASDLDDAVDTLRAAIALTPRLSSLRAGRLGNLGLATREQYRRDGDARTLKRVVETFSTALQMARGPAATATALTNLALGLQDRYLLTGDMHDLKRAVGHARRAYESSERAGAAVMLADLLRLRFQATGAPGDLTTAVMLLREAAAATPSASPDRPRRLVDLGIAVLDQHAESGDPNDLTDALGLFNTAVATMPHTSPDHPAALVHLALAHLRSYEAKGGLDNLSSAVDELRMATGRAGAAGADAGAWTVNLAAALHERARRSGDAEDLNSSITLLEGLVAAPSDSVDRFAAVNNLGNALRDRYRVTHDDQDLTHAVEVLLAAVDLAPAQSVRSATLLANLGAAYHDRFVANGAAQDLEAACRCLRGATEMTGATDLDRPRRLFAFALAARTRFHLTGDPTDLVTAKRAFAEGCALGRTDDPLETLAAGQEWGSWAGGHEHWADAAVALGSALDALLALVRVQLTREHKETWLRTAAAVPAHAAYANLMLHRPQNAVLSLEAGRATILTDALERERIDLTVLAADRSDLVERFERAANRLRHVEGRHRSAT